MVSIYSLEDHHFYPPVFCTFEERKIILRAVRRVKNFPLAHERKEKNRRSSGVAQPPTDR